jgi:hypothetical protein
MLIQPVDYFLLAWFTLSAASVLYVGIDQYRNNPAHGDEVGLYSGLRCTRVHSVF